MLTYHYKTNGSSYFLENAIPQMASFEHIFDHFYDTVCTLILLKWLGKLIAMECFSRQRSNLCDYR